MRNMESNRIEHGNRWEEIKKKRKSINSKIALTELDEIEAKLGKNDASLTVRVIL